MLLEREQILVVLRKLFVKKLKTDPSNVYKTTNMGLPTNMPLFIKHFLQ